MPNQGRPTLPIREKIATRIGLLLILLIAAWIQFTVVSRTTVISPIRADASEYFSDAYNLTTFGVYSQTNTWENSQSNPATPIADGYRTPGYPLFLALLGNPQPDDAYLHRVNSIQAVLGVFSVWLIYLISARFLGAGWSHAVAFLTAISPQMATISTYLLTESLFVFLLFSALYTLLLAIESKRLWLYALTGVLWGLASLVRPTVEFLPPIMLVATLMIPRLRHLARVATLGFACFALVMAPWFIRNQTLPLVTSQPSLMVKFLQHGSYPNFMYAGLQESFGFPYDYDPHSEQISRDLPSILQHIAENFRQDPATYIRWYLIGKPGFFLSWSSINDADDIFIYSVSRTPYLDDNRFAMIRKVMLIAHWPLMLLGLAGALLVWLRPKWLALDDAAQPAAQLVAGIVFYAIVLHMIGTPLPRYALPFRPFLYALALMAVTGLWRYGRQSRSSLPAAPFADDLSVKQ